MRVLGQLLDYLSASRSRFQHPSTLTQGIPTDGLPPTPSHNVSCLALLLQVWTTTSGS